MPFNNTYNAIMALTDGDEATRFLKSVAGQIMFVRRQCSCASGRRAFRAHFEKKLEWYWNEYAPKEQKHGNV